MVYFYLTSLMWLAGVALSVLVIVGKNTAFKKLSKGKWILFGSLIAWGETGGNSWGNGQNVEGCCWFLLLSFTCVCVSGLPAIIALVTGIVEGLLGQPSVDDT